MTLAYSREKFESPAIGIPQKRNESPFAVAVCLFQTFAQEWDIWYSRNILCSIHVERFSTWDTEQS